MQNLGAQLNQIAFMNATNTHANLKKKKIACNFYLSIYPMICVYFEENTRSSIYSGFESKPER